MTYLSVDVTIQDAAPVFLYLFSMGDDSWRFTSAADAQTYDSQTWTPSPIAHEEIVQSNELARDMVPLHFPVTDSFAAQFLGYSPDNVVSVTIYRFHRDDLETIVYWKGRVAGSKVRGMEITLECESIFTSMRRTGLRGRYQRNCIHVLYGFGCSLDQADFGVTDTPTAYDQTTVTVPDAALQEDGYYTGGMIKYETTYRLVTGHAGAVLTLVRAIDSLNQAIDDGDSGLEVTIYPGCDRSRTTCNTKFDNLDNFLGFPWIPLNNPFSGKSLV